MFKNQEDGHGINCAAVIVEARPAFRKLAEIFEIFLKNCVRRKRASDEGGDTAQTTSRLDTQGRRLFCKSRGERDGRTVREERNGFNRSKGAVLC